MLNKLENMHFKAYKGLQCHHTSDFVNANKTMHEIISALWLARFPAPFMAFQAVFL